MDDNILIDKDFDFLFIIDWEKSFIRSGEISTFFLVGLLIYSEALFPMQRNEDGKVMKTSKAAFNDREKYIFVIKFQKWEKALYLFLFSDCLQDIIFLIKRQKDKTL